MMVVVAVFQVEPDSLRTVAVSLADADRPHDGAIAVVAPGVDATSQGAASVLTGCAQSLTTALDYARALREHGGQVLGQIALAFKAGDENLTPEASVLPAPPAPPTPLADLDASAAVAELAPMTGTGKQLADALYGGPGSVSMHHFAQTCAAHTSDLAELADELRQHATAIGTHWTSGTQAANNTTAHAGWVQTVAASRASALATVANAIADSFDHAKNSSPSPDEFTQTFQALARAQAANVDGSHDSEVTALTHTYADQQAQAEEAYHTYHANTVAALAPLRTPLRPVPPIAHPTGAPYPPAAQPDNGLPWSPPYP